MIAWLRRAWHWWFDPRYPRWDARGFWDNGPPTHDPPDTDPIE